MSNEATTVVFNKVWNLESVKMIPYDPKWENGTGYFDNACKMVKLAPGERAKSVTGPANNRRILFIGTKVGTIAVFQRYTNGERGIYVNNWPDNLRHLQDLVDAKSALSADTIEKIVGTDFELDINIGEFIEKFAVLTS